jgi:soluble lytic murein transglycosylase-like protein
MKDMAETAVAGFSTTTVRVRASDATRPGGATRIRSSLILSTFLVSLASSCKAAAVDNVCEAEMTRAAREHDVPVAVLYAVALTETGQRGALHPYAMNIHGRPAFNATLQDALGLFEAARRQGEDLVDIGCMQINYRYHNRRFDSVEEMFDPRKNVDYAAQFLKALQHREGTWTATVARYHAGPGNAPAQHRYVCAVIRNMVKSGFGAWTAESEAFCGR